MKPRIYRDDAGWKLAWARAQSSYVLGAASFGGALESLRELDRLGLVAR